MPERTYYVPAAGLRVVDPANGEPLPPEGREVAGGNEIYWLRRMREGDVAEGKAASADVIGRFGSKGKKE